MSKVGMTSTEAAALYLSDGKTDDPGLASMLDYAKKQPELLIPKGRIGEAAYKPAPLVIEDPDELERQRLRNLIGFDVDVTIDEKTGKATLTDKQYKYQVRVTLGKKEQTQAKQLSKAIIKLKVKHDRHSND